MQAKANATFQKLFPLYTYAVRLSKYRLEVTKYDRKFSRIYLTLGQKRNFLQKYNVDSYTELKKNTQMTSDQLIHASSKPIRVT